MKLTILDETGDTVLTDRPVTKGMDRVKNASTEEIKTEFDKLVKDGYIPVNDKTKKLVRGTIKKTDEVTMLYPTIGG